MVNPPMPASNSSVLAFRCVQAPVAYRTSMVMAERSETVCMHGDTFFGKQVTARDGSLWLSVESNNLFLPIQDV
eukprot:Skav224972  [mRNA]  locus=scaffold560:8649:8870:+ [translate_table: standard]